MIRLQRIYFSHAFPLVLDSNLHDLNETNPGLTLFSAELPWCCFCTKIKVLGMERNFARIFYGINENFWSQDPLERGPWLGTTHLVAPLTTPLYYKITYFQKKWGRKNYRVPRDGAAAKPYSSSGGQIWSPFGAPERGIFVLRHHQPISIANSMMLPTGSE